MGGISYRYVGIPQVMHAFIVPASEMATNNIPHKLEIEYGSTPGQKLDILGTDLPDGKTIFSLLTVF